MAIVEIGPVQKCSIPRQYEIEEGIIILPNPLVFGLDRQNRTRIFCRENFNMNKKQCDASNYIHYE